MSAIVRLFMGVVVMVNKWANNTKRYLFGLGLTEEVYKNKKITKHQKDIIEAFLKKGFDLNYWKLNPNLKNPLLKEIFNRMINTYEIGTTPNTGSGKNV